jgi:hypothetical protein
MAIVLLDKFVKMPNVLSLRGVSLTAIVGMVNNVLRVVVWRFSMNHINVKTMKIVVTANFALTINVFLVHYSVVVLMAIVMAKPRNVAMALVSNVALTAIVVTVLALMENANLMNSLF